jgi:hypothetical protein
MCGGGKRQKGAEAPLREARRATVISETQLPCKAHPRGQKEKAQGRQKRTDEEHGKRCSSGSRKARRDRDASLHATRTLLFLSAGFLGTCPRGYHSFIKNTRDASSNTHPSPPSLLNSIKQSKKKKNASRTTESSRRNRFQQQISQGIVTHVPAHKNRSSVVEKQQTTAAIHAYSTSTSSSAMSM